MLGNLSDPRPLKHRLVQLDLGDFHAKSTIHDTVELVEPWEGLFVPLCLPLLDDFQLVFVNVFTAVDVGEH